MLDWTIFITNALWIFGLSMALSSFGWAVWEKTENHVSISAFYSRTTPARVIHIARLLVCTGFALTVATLWERALWIILDIWFLVDTFLFFRKKK
jgi:hypothetical protein